MGVHAAGDDSLLRSVRCWQVRQNRGRTQPRRHADQAATSGSVQAAPSRRARARATFPARELDMEQCPTRWRVSARGGHTSPLLTDGLVLIVLTPGHQVFLCAARSSDPRSLSFSLYFLHFSSLRRNGSFPYHGLQKYRIPNQICTDAPKKETTQKHTKIISSRLAVRIRSALSLLQLKRTRQQGRGSKLELLRLALGWLG